MIKNIVFDIDGTLIDTEKAYMNALLDVLNNDHQLSFTYEQVIAYYGIPGTEALLSLGFSEAEVPTLLNEWYQKFENYKDLVQVFPGIINTLQQLTKYPVALSIVTSKTKDELDYDFAELGLKPFFEFIITSSDTKAHKPNPEPLLKMIELSKIPASETLYIGDTQFDMQCAHSAHAEFGLAGWGAHDRGQFTAIDYLFSRPAEIIDLIR